MKTKVLILAAVTAATLAGAEWRALDDEHHISGPKLSPADLAGKVVFVDEWGIHCPPCRRLLSQLAKYHESFSHKPFVLIGSHRQSGSPEEVRKVLAEAKAHYPVYSGFGLAVGEPDNGGGIPFMYVVDRSGRVVYSGRDDKAAIEAAINAFSGAGIVAESLVAGVALKKYKPLEKKFVLGKSIKSELKKLQRDAEAKNSPYAGEARQVLEAIAAAKSKVEEEISFSTQSDPVKAFGLVKLYMATWPDDGKERYAAGLKELQERAKEAEKAAKEKAKAEKKRK
ncbi:MAG: TlpA family protein disulfide reductase [Kiritimatiellae bacterium]|nr:TlpA family protein disulfide reductase [Kiritimatiellia bacterium]